MENNISQVETLFEKTKHYTQTSVELYKLKAIDKSADVISTLAARLAVGVFVTLFFLILNVGISLWLGEILGKSYYGFFIVSGFYAVGAILLYVFRNKWIKTSVRNSIVVQALN